MELTEQQVLDELQGQLESEEGPRPHIRFRMESEPGELFRAVDIESIREHDGGAMVTVVLEAV